MEEKDLSTTKIDLIFLVRIWLPYARRFWALALILAILGSCCFGFMGYRAYTPVYEASVSFTVKVSNPLYGSINSYNNATAKQLNSTFPYILRSAILRQRVSEYLGVSSIPSVNTTVMENSNIFTMRVRHSNPEWAYEVLRAMIECYPQVADYVVGGTDLIMLDESGVPNKPVYDLDLTDHLMIGAAGGLVIWFAFTLLLTLGRRTIHNEDELQRTLNFTCLGIVPATKVVGKDKRCPLIHHDSGKFGFAESVRLLQMHVSKEMRAQNKKILMVSGATPGEGKTTIAVNLAIASAKAGKRTLLVDCDQYNPSVSRSLSVEKNVTMREYMQGTVGAKDLLSKTRIRHLYCMNTGVDVKDKGVKDSFDMLLRAARETFDIIILDTPPCSLMVDAAELSDLADCALMVIRQDYASRDQIIEGVRLLTDNGLPMLGCALNGVNGNLATYGYQYGNGYGYGYGYGYSYGYGYGRKYGYGYGSKKQDSD